MVASKEGMTALVVVEPSSHNGNPVVELGSHDGDVEAPPRLWMMEQWTTGTTNIQCRTDDWDVARSFERERSMQHVGFEASTCRSLAGLAAD